jgi:ATP-binding cassette subfamily B protein
MKFYDITDGDIKIDGHSIKELSRSNIHDLFCMVLQNTWLFKGTIKENIVYNQDNISLEEVIQACKFAGIADFIETLPDKYDTVLEDHNNLSEGQKQLLTIARAIVDKSPFLILDEATSSVDRKTEEVVQRSMDTLMKGRTSFIIAHRLSTIQNADLILVMDKGNIVEHGNHSELIAKDGMYTELYNSQFAC